MYYPRPAFGDPSVKTVEARMMFSNAVTQVPVMDYPVTPLENFRLAAARKTPYWIPNSSLDFQSKMSQQLSIGEATGPDFSSRERRTFKDWFGAEWIFLPEAGGPMLKPGCVIMDDVTEWESKVKFPDLSAYDWKTPAEKFLKNDYDPNKVLHINIGQGCTERLVSLMGGYTNTLMNMAVEPEACRDFFERFVDFTIEFYDLLKSLYPINFVTYHDDWGTERDTFFSENMMEELLLEPSKRLVQHIKSTGAAFELHSCGNVTRFIPYMIDMGVDFMQIQRRAVDIPAVKEKYGKDIGINTWIENPNGTMITAEDDVPACVRATAELYGKGGGFYTSVRCPDPKAQWDGVFELYCHSREMYDKERGE